MKVVEDVAFLSVSRACGFSGLAVFCIILGLSFKPALALQVGAILSLIMCFCLLLMALRARSKPYKTTETWIILPKADRPPPAIAQLIIGTALREVYFWFAKFTAAVAFLLFGMSILLRLSG